jgi:hypothetical protein
MKSSSNLRGLANELVWQGMSEKMGMLSPGRSEHARRTVIASGSWVEERTIYLQKENPSSGRGDF